MDKSDFLKLILGFIGMVADHVTDHAVQVDVGPSGLMVRVKPHDSADDRSINELAQDSLPLGGRNEKPATSTEESS